MIVDMLIGMAGGAAASIVMLLCYIWVCPPVQVEDNMESYEEVKSILAHPQAGEPQGREIDWAA